MEEAFQAQEEITEKDFQNYIEETRKKYDGNEPQELLSSILIASLLSNKSL